MNTNFLHTEPHHDDIMLGYLPGVLRNTRVASNEHHFVCGPKPGKVSNALHFFELVGASSYGTAPELCLHERSAPITSS